jgi:hypothetical protein
VSYILRWGENIKWCWSRPVAARSLAQLLSGRVEGSSIFHVSTSTQLSGEPRYDVTVPWHHANPMWRSGHNNTIRASQRHHPQPANLVSSCLVSSRLFSSLLVPSHPVLLHLTSTHHVCLWSSSRLEPSCTQHRRGSCMSPPAVIITAKGTFLFRAQTATSYHSDVSRDFQVLWPTLIQSHCKRIDSSAQSPAAAASTTIVLEALSVNAEVSPWDIVQYTHCTAPRTCSASSRTPLRPSIILDSPSLYHRVFSSVDGYGPCGFKT